MQKITRLIRAKDKALEDLENGIFSEMERIARILNLDKMFFGIGYGEFTRNNKEVFSTRLKNLEDLYLDHVNKCGFMGLWTKEKGWYFGDETPNSF